MRKFAEMFFMRQQVKNSFTSLFVAEEGLVVNDTVIVPLLGLVSYLFLSTIFFFEPSSLNVYMHLYGASELVHGDGNCAELSAL